MEESNLVNSLTLTLWMAHNCSQYVNWVFVIQEIHRMMSIALQRLQTHSLLFSNLKKLHTYSSWNDTCDDTLHQCPLYFLNATPNQGLAYQLEVYLDLIGSQHHHIESKNRFGTLAGNEYQTNCTFLWQHVVWIISIPEWLILKVSTSRYFISVSGWF